MITESAYTTLERVASIKDKPERRQALREVLSQRVTLSLLVQYTFHPDVHFDVYKGMTPEPFKRTDHDDYSMLHRFVKKLKQYSVGNPIPRDKKESLWKEFIHDLPKKDGELMDHVKDKRLPWKTLNRSFVVRAVPELFPASFVEVESKDDSEVEE